MTELLLTLHRWDAYLSIVLMLVSGLYGLALHWRHYSFIPREYKVLLVAGATLLVLQVFFGLSLLASGLRPAPLLHMLIYGALSPLILPGTYAYIRQQGSKHPNLAFGLASLFLFAFLIRGVFTA